VKVRRSVLRADNAKNSSFFVHKPHITGDTVFDRGVLAVRMASLRKEPI
jgi:hypothetical protein